MHKRGRRRGKFKKKISTLALSAHQKYLIRAPLLDILVLMTGRRYKDISSGIEQETRNYYTVCVGSLPSS